MKTHICMYAYVHTYTYAFSKLAMHMDLEILNLGSCDFLITLRYYKFIDNKKWRIIPPFIPHKCPVLT